MKNLINGTKVIITTMCKGYNGKIAKVTEKINDYNYKIQLASGEIFKVNIDEIEIFNYNRILESMLFFKGDAVKNCKTKIKGIISEKTTTSNYIVMYEDSTVKTYKTFGKCQQFNELDVEGQVFNKYNLA